MTRVQTRVLSNLRTYRPTCSSLWRCLCASCVQDFAIYHLTFKFRAFKEKFGKFRSQRHYARQFGTTHIDMESDLAKTRFTLWAEFHDLVLKLMDIAQINSALHARLLSTGRNEIKFHIERSINWYGSASSTIPSRLIVSSISFWQNLLRI